MRIVNKLVLVITAVMLSLGFAGAAYAHVGISDDDGQIAAVLQVGPDDNPVAGKETTITFDVKLQALLPSFQSAALLVINKADKTSESVRTTVSGSTVTGKYTFKHAGTYQLWLILAGDQHGASFHHDQIVGAGTPSAVGVTKSTPQQSQTLWAMGGLLVAIAVIGSISLVALRRKPKVKL